MSLFLLHCSELPVPSISGCKPRQRRLILRDPMALKEAFAPEAVAPDFRSAPADFSVYPESLLYHIF